MPRFRVQFATASGRIEIADMEAASERAVLATLETRGDTPISVKSADHAAAAGPPNARLRTGRAVRRALLNFTHQMAAVIESSIPVIQGLNAVAEQTDHPGLRAALRRVASRVEGGQTLAEGLAAEPEFFPSIYIKSVAAGEAAGRLADVFQSLSQYLEEAAETRSQVKSALTYPALVIGVLVIAVVVMLILVIPRFQDMFAKYSSELPLPTQVVMLGSNMLRHHYLTLIAGLVCSWFALKALMRDRRFRVWFDEKKLRIPIFGTLLIGAYMHRMVELLNLLTRSALPITNTLRITADSMENEAFKSDVRQMLRAVEGGRTLGEAFADTRWLTPLVKRMLAIGEQAGRTDQIFDYLARYYARQTKQMVKMLSTLVEPLLIASLAVVILFFALAIFLPMFKMLRMVATT